MLSCTVKHLIIGTPKLITTFFLSKNRTALFFNAVMRFKDVDGKANSVNPDHTAHSEAV